jgi:kynureninase
MSKCTAQQKLRAPRSGAIVTLTEVDTTMQTPARSVALELDARDPLASYRTRFAIADDALLYMDGNSLGRPPQATLDRAHTLLEEEWRGRLIRSWSDNWYEAPIRIGEKIALLLGAAPGQVIVADSTSVNLFKLVMAVLRAQSGRPVVVTDALNFPSDLHVVQSCFALMPEPHRLRVVGSRDGRGIDYDDLAAAIDDETALVLLSHVTFKSGFVHEMEMVNRLAHQHGALTLWDLSHSVGVLPIELDADRADLAVGCTYKYLNGGPGAPAFLYVRLGLQEHLQSPIWGWFGDAAPFAFDVHYQPAPGMRRFLVGTPPILSLAAIEPSVDLVLEAGITAIREKSRALTVYGMTLADAILAPQGYQVTSPREDARRGSQVSLSHPEAWRITRALIEELEMVPDFRTPDTIRLGMPPLYTRFIDIWDAVDRLRRAVEEQRFVHYAHEHPPVT